MLLLMLFSCLSLAWITPILAGMAETLPSSADSVSREAELIDGLRANDPRAYEQLVQEYGGRMMAVARRLLRNEEDARDAVQEAFLGSFRNLQQFEGSSRLSTWLHRIVVNASLMKLRSKSRKPEQSIDALLPTFNSSGESGQLSRRWRPDIPDALEQKETRQLVQGLIGSLPEAYRTVLMLRDIEELDTKETAEALGVSENAVKTRLHRARQALKGMLDKQFAGDPA